MSTTSKGIRRPVLAGDEVYAESLPRCLRHVRDTAPLEHALDIANVIHILYMSIASESWAGQAKALQGMEHITALLIDKIEIGMGRYKFPRPSWKDEAPDLAEREAE